MEIGSLMEEVIKLRLQLDALLGHFGIVIPELDARATALCDEAFGSIPPIDGRMCSGPPVDSSGDPKVLAERLEIGCAAHVIDGPDNGAALSAADETDGKVSPGDLGADGLEGGSGALGIGTPGCNGHGSLSGSGRVADCAGVAPTAPVPLP